MQPGLPGFRTYLTMLFGLGSFFLVLDFLRRGEHYFLPLSVLIIISNVAAAVLYVAVLSVLGAALLWTLQTLLQRLPGFRTFPDKPGLFIVYLLFVSINIQHLKLQFGDSIPHDGSLTACLICYATLGLVLLAFPRWGSRVTFRDGFLAHANALSRWMGGVVLAAAVALSASLGWQTWDRQPASPKPVRALPNIVLVTFDSLGARHVGCYGYKVPTTPNLDALARDSFVFDACHACSNETTFSLCDVLGYHFALHYPEETLFQQLEDAGYDTLFVSHFQPSLVQLPIKPHVMLESLAAWPAIRALDRRVHPHNFLWLDLLTTDELPYFNPYDPLVQTDYYLLFGREHFPPEVAFDYVADRLQSTDRPLFVWVHIWAPHYPYLPVPPFRGRLQPGEFSPEMRRTVARNIAQKIPNTRSDIVGMARNLYDEYVMEADSEFGTFLSNLKASGAYDKSILVVSADHGEAFNVGFILHGGPVLPEEMVHIPLILHLPGSHTQSRIRTNTQLTDVGPTLLSLLQHAVPKTMQGESLLPYMRSPEAQSDQWKVSFSSSVFREGVGEVAVYSGRYKLVFRYEDHARHWLYDLTDDPGESHDLAALHPEVVSAYLDAMEVTDDGLPGRADF